MCRIIPYDPTVKDLFEEAELSQREAAAKLGVSPALVNQLLNRGTLPKTGWAGIKKGLASLLEERGRTGGHCRLRPRQARTAYRR